MIDKRETQCCAFGCGKSKKSDLGVTAKAVVMKNQHLKSSILGLFTQKLRYFQLRFDQA